MIHGYCRVLTILVFRSVTNTLLYLFHNALDHNDSSALPGHFTRTTEVLIDDGRLTEAALGSRELKKTKIFLNSIVILVHEPIFKLF